MSVLVPETLLRDRHASIVEATEQARRRLVETDGDAEIALRYFLAFAEDGVELGVTSEEQRFYNRYYWFKRFAKLHQAAHGYDAGIEDQVSQLLERAPSDVDWKIVEELSATLE